MLTIDAIERTERVLERLTTQRRTFAPPPLADWAQQIVLEGKPFTFHDHAYLRAIYDDHARHIVLCKATQIGGSVWAVLRSIHSCLKGLNVIYFFPNRTDVIDFSKGRVSPLLEENAFLSRMMQDTDTAGLKRIGTRHLYFRGMQSQIGMKSVPADLIVFDELDETEPNAKAMAKERLAHSDHKRIIELSNPSLPEYGIDESFQLSDQRHWTMRCAACGEWTCLEKEFPQKLGQDVRVLLPQADGSVIRACKKCSAELDPEQGEWVADFPSRDTHGYLISQLFSAKVDPKEILSEYRTTRYPDRFYNLKIGIPWADVSRRLDVPFVLSKCSDYALYERAAAQRYSVMGVDTGKDLHVVVMQENREIRGWDLVYLEACDNFERLDHLITLFRPGRLVIDGLPETHSTRAFAKRHRGQVFLSYFSETQKVEPKLDDEAQTITINRTDALDASRALIRDGFLRLPRQSEIVEEFAHHVAADAKVLEEDEETGAKKYRYIRTGPDHYSLALTYAAMAAHGKQGVIGPNSIPRARAWSMPS